MCRFVILRHEFPHGSDPSSHWDIMFEERGVLLTWACHCRPDSKAVGAARQLADHRLAYLDYEGPVSGDRGTVTRWDEGTYRASDSTADRWAVELHGKRLAGRLVLSLKDHATGVWSIVYSPD